MHLISARQFSKREYLDDFLDVTDQLFTADDSSYAGLNDMELFEAKYRSPYFGKKIMATLFYEPSTRTRFSFEAAMRRLGGAVISESSPANLSVAKGESLEDTIRTVSQYVDLIVLRHPQKGAAERAVKVADVPIINAGDGSGEHPTQALLDVYTIRQNFKLDGLTVLFCGDLKNGRTTHSLMALLSLYKNVKFIFCCPQSLMEPKEVSDLLFERGMALDCCWCETLEKGLALQPDVVYMTRLQKERFDSEEHNRMSNWMPTSFNWKDFCLTPKLMGLLPEKSIVIHPLPRNDELPPEIDNDPRCIYFRHQVRNGLKVRMGLLYCLFGDRICYIPPL